jgi:phosphate binding protein
MDGAGLWRCTLSRNVEGLSLADLLQICALGRRTCHVHVSDRLTSGDLFLQNGRAVHATFGRLRGEVAVLEMLARAGIYVRVDGTPAPRKRTLDRDAQELVFEAARRVDEHRRAASEPGVPLPQPPRTRSALYAVVVVGIALAAAATGLHLRRESSGIAAAAVAAAPQPDEPPRLLSAAKPMRPRVDLALAPTIVCRLRIEPDGRISERRVYHSRLDLAAFEDAALDAAAKFQFAPARHAGAPVAAWLNVPISFDAADAVATVRVKGSDTIGGALGPALAAAYQSKHATRVTVEALGSATAFVGLFDGSADIGASSRPIDAKELAQARALNITLEEHVIGYDGVAVIVNQRNALPSLSIDQLSRLFTGQLARWSDVGGAPRSVHLVGRPVYSGTHAFFKERVLRRGVKDGREEFADSIRAYERNEEIVQAVAADPDAIGYVGLGWVSKDVRAVPIASGERAIEASRAAIRDGSYPLYRPLLFYTRGTPHAEVAAFLRFALSTDGQALVAQHGFVPTDVPAAVAANDTQDAEPTVPPIRLLFRTARVTLDDDSRRTLTQVASRLSRGHERALVVGHADADGQQDNNRLIARARAEKVAAFLKQAGAPENSVALDDASADHPIATNATAEGRKLNRRVDVFLLPQ